MQRDGKCDDCGVHLVSYPDRDGNFLCYTCAESRWIRAAGFEPEKVRGCRHWGAVGYCREHRDDCRSLLGATCHGPQKEES